MQIDNPNLLTLAMIGCLGVAIFGALFFGEARSKYSIQKTIDMRRGDGSPIHAIFMSSFNVLGGLAIMAVGVGVGMALALKNGLL